MKIRDFSRRLLRFKWTALTALLGPLLLLAGGCASFNRDWNNTPKWPGATDLEGRWKGVWISDVTHHTDELRCVIRKNDDGTYRARFHAKYHTVLTFGYTVKLNATPAANGFTFNGQADLGWYAGGLYHYEGHADATNFFSKYSCKYDRGTFQMKRP